MSTGDEQNYEAVQTSAFTEQVEKGNYDEDFEHSDYLKSFFERAMGEVMPHMPAGRFSVIDAGCGTGAWLYYLLKNVLPAHGRQGDAIPFGFDLTQAMVALAAKHLTALDPDAHVWAGSVLEDAAYQFDGGPERYDLVFSFDVVQQLPVPNQFDAVRQLIARTKPGGYCVIFDHDWHSPYGYKMAAKKFLTSRVGIPLLPLYYCNAKYPPLEKFRQRIERDGLGKANIITPVDGKKRALIICVS